MIKEDEMVNHPSHYNLPGQKECIELMEELFGIDAVGIFSAVTSYKYLYRKGNKTGNPEVQDMNKSKWYVDKMNEMWNKQTTHSKIFSAVYDTMNEIIEELGEVNYE